MTTIAAQAELSGITPVNSINGVQTNVHPVHLHRVHTARSFVSPQQLNSRLEKLDGGDVLSLSPTAQDYLEEKQSESINQVTDQLNMAAKIVSNSTTSDSQRFAVIASAYHLFFEGSTLGAITGSFASAWGRFKAATSGSDFDKYFAVEKQFVPSMNGADGNYGQKAGADLWTQFFVNNRSSGARSGHFSQALSQNQSVSEANLQKRENLQSEIDHLAREVNSVSSGSASTGSASLISLVNMEKGVAPQEKQVLEKIRDDNRKKESLPLKAAK